MKRINGAIVVGGPWSIERYKNAQSMCLSCWACKPSKVMENKSITIKHEDMNYTICYVCEFISSCCPVK